MSSSTSTSTSTSPLKLSPSTSRKVVSRNRKKFTTSVFSSILIISFIYSNLLCTIQKLPLLAYGAKHDYYYTRTRFDPNHLRISEEFKNDYVNDVKFESKINGTKYEYYKSSLSLSHDELVFETIDKMFKHRLSAFYIHHYDNEEDKKRASDPKLVSPEACARDLMYLIERMPNQPSASSSSPGSAYDFDVHSTTPEVRAFFDSYAREESGLLMGNTYWEGSYDQCVNRHIFDLNDDGVSPSTPLSTSNNKDHSQPDKLTSTAKASREQQEKPTEFKGRYCVSSLKAPSWDKLIKARKVKGRNYFKTERQMEDYSRLFRLQIGVCLPSSCDSTSLERHSEELKMLITAQLDKRYHEYELIDLYCLPDETSPLRSISGSALNFLLFMTLWSTLLFLATLADVFEFVDLESGPPLGSSRRARKVHKFVSWFSLRANYRKLMKVNPEEAGEVEQQQQQQKKKMKKSTSSSSSSSSSENVESEEAAVGEAPKFDLKVNLRFLNAFKVLIMFWIVNGHIMLLMIQTARNILYSDALLNGFMHFLIGATFGVDLFFTMTGFLTSYLIFNSGHAYKMRITTWLYLTFHRYWRLAPMYVLTFWFSRSLAQLLGSGPLWDYGTSNITFRGLCNTESWYYPLTLTSNLHGLFEECMITSWYISCDMQFWLVSPIFLHLLAKSPLSGWVASLATIIMSAKVRYDAILSDKSARYDELVQPRADIFMRVSHDLPALYTNPHYRISAYIVGLLAGHYVYMIKSGKWSSSIASGSRAASELVATGGGERLAASADSKACHKKAEQEGEKEEEEEQIIYTTKTNVIRSAIAYSGLSLFLVMAFVSYLLANFFPSSLLVNSRMVAGVAYSLNHLVMSFSASLVIVAMCFGQWPGLVAFLSKPNWTRLSKVNYALLLLQCEAIYFQIFRYENVPLAGTREHINILFNLLVTLYPAAFVITLAFEFPLANIEKLLM